MTIKEDISEIKNDIKEIKSKQESIDQKVAILDDWRSQKIRLRSLYAIVGIGLFSSVISLILHFL